MLLRNYRNYQRRKCYNKYSLNVCVNIYSPYILDFVGFQKRNIILKLLFLVN